MNTFYDDYEGDVVQGLLQKKPWNPTPFPGKDVNRAGMASPNQISDGRFNAQYGDWQPQVGEIKQVDPLDDPEWTDFISDLWGKGKGVSTGKSHNLSPEDLADKAAKNKRDREETEEGIGKHEDNANKFLEQYLKGLDDKETQINLKPLLALSDAWYGGNLAAAYDVPMTVEEREALKFKINLQIEENKRKAEKARTYTKYLNDVREDKKLAEEREFKYRVMRDGMVAATKAKQAEDKAKADFLKYNKDTIYKDAIDLLPEASRDNKVAGRAQADYLLSRTSATIENAKRAGQFMTYEQAYQSVLAAMRQ